jgi:hypothetical protein
MKEGNMSVRQFADEEIKAMLHNRVVNVRGYLLRIEFLGENEIMNHSVNQ